MEHATENTSVGSTTLNALFLAVLLVGAGSTQAMDTGPGFPLPEQAGHYAIGHTTVALTDHTRNLDGSTPVTTAGRFVHLDIRYPTTVEVSGHVTNSWNHPIYNDNSGGLVHPGLPELPPLTAAVSTIRPALGRLQ